MTNQQQSPSFDELRASLQTAIQHPLDTGWAIYRYLKANIPQKTGRYHNTLTNGISSEEARTLLATYTKMKLPAPSMLHSCMLMVALNMSDVYPDFRLDSFLRIWGYPQNLRDEDKVKQVGKDGRSYLSLAERADRAIQSYILHHGQSATIPSADVNAQHVPIRTMMAVKVFTTERNGRKLNSVKLIAADGQEMIAEQHQFPCKPWQIIGTMFDVLTRTSKNDNVRAQEIVLSNKNVADVFNIQTGYVDRFDQQHGHYHVFDNMSRHFVAENPRLKPVIGGFVQFAPIVPAVDKFKVAVIIKVMTIEEGLSSFGIYQANVTYINNEKGYFYYKITSQIKPTTEGEMTAEGSAQLALIPKTIGEVKTGMAIKLIVILMRGKDGKKRNRVVKIIG